MKTCQADTVVEMPAPHTSIIGASSLSRGEILTLQQKRGARRARPLFDGLMQRLHARAVSIIESTVFCFGCRTSAVLEFEWGGQQTGHRRGESTTARLISPVHTGLGRDVLPPHYSASRLQLARGRARQARVIELGLCERRVFVGSSLANLG